MRLGRRIRHGRIAMPAMLLVTAGALLAARTSTVSAQQPPTFRSTVDLVAVDVQVVDKDGRPIGTLKPGDFDVQIAGKKRRVVSADFIESAEHRHGQWRGRHRQMAAGPVRR